jgi:cob(I)alamin adenosyltransferase
MKIYTKTGDSGETALFGAGRVRKDDIRVDAYGEVDELNAALGVAIACLRGERSALLPERLGAIQSDLFAIGAHLATPAAATGGRGASRLPPLPAERVAEMEAWIDAADERLPPLRNFILPAGSEGAAALHLARTVCRRAERRVVALASRTAVSEGVIVYLNRLSDLLFTFARIANLDAGVGDVPWSGRS